MNEEPARRVRLLVAYDGSAFSGFAKNLDVVTVAGELERHIAKVARHPVTITGAGRTDKGVHAWGQVVTFDTWSDRIEPQRLARSINSVLGPQIAVRDASLVPLDFDARFSATWRRYRYTILRSAAPNPFLANTAWHLDEPLDLDAMRAASERFLGSHDFSSFCRRPPAAPGRPERSLERTVTELVWRELPDEVLQMQITAKAFCHQMVRSITGTIVDVGRGRFSPEDIDAVFAARDRNAGGRLAPPHGLCLHEVGYESTSTFATR